MSTSSKTAPPKKPKLDSVHALGRQIVLPKMEDKIRSFLVFDDTEGIQYEITGQRNVPLPKPLAQKLFFSQGLGCDMVANHQPVEKHHVVHVNTEEILFTSSITTLKIYAFGKCWNWDAAKPNIWTTHKIYTPGDPIDT